MGAVLLPIKLSTSTISTHEGAVPYVTLDTTEQNPSNNGLIIVSGDSVSDGLGYTPFAGSAYTATINGIEGFAPSSLSSALFNNIHLNAGESLRIVFEYDFKDDGNNDFAFGLIGRAGAPADGFLMADGNSYNANGDVIYTSTINVDTTGDYNLLLASSDAGDTRQHSNLIVHSVSKITPDSLYTVTPTGLRLPDGTQDLANGSVVLPNGVPGSALFAAGGQSSIAKLISQDGGSLISQDGGSLISQDGGGLISQDGGGLLSQDGGGIQSHPNAGLVAQGAGNLLSQDGGGLVAQGAGNLLSQDGGGIVAQGAGNLVAQGAGNFHLTSLAYKSSSDQDALAVSRPNITTPSLTLQTATVIGSDRLVGEMTAPGAVESDPHIAALSDGGYVVVWADNLAGHFEIRLQLRNADGTAIAPSLVVSTDTGSDQSNPSVTALSGGKYVVSWLGHSFDSFGNKSAADVHTQLFGADGTKIGNEQRIGSTALEETGARVVSTANGGYAVLLEAVTPGDSGNTGIGQFYDANGVLQTSFGFGSTAAGTLKLAAAGAGLADGGLAIAYGEHNTSAPDQDGIYLDIVSAAGAVTHAEVQVNSTTPGVQGIPATARLVNGNIVVAWIDGGPANGPDISTLRAQILDPTGAKVGGEIRIADTLKGGDAPSIAALADGRFDVTWVAPIIKNGTVVSLNLHSQIFSADGTNASPVFDITTPSIDNAYRVSASAEAQLTNGTLAFAGQVTVGATSTIHTDLFNVGAPAAPQPPTDPAPATFTHLTPDVAVGSFPNALSVGDVNGDGKTDLLTVDTNEAHVILGRGDGTFAADTAAVIPIGGVPSAGAFANLNGDGKLDFVTGGQSDQTARAFLGNGDGTFMAQAPTSGFVDRFVGHLELADVTADGKADIVMGGNSGVSIAAGNGDGTFQIPKLISLSSQVTQAVLGDLNGDGKLDIVATQTNANAVTVILNNGNGTFATPVAIPVITGPDSAAVADINSDGKLDIVVGINNGNVPTDDNVVVLLGNGDGTFQAPITTVLSRATRALAVGDLNGDGHPDVVTANGGFDSNSQYTSTVLLGRGDGTFLAQSPLAVGSDPDSVALADLNGDGRLDVTVSNFSNGTVSVFLNGTAPATTGAPVPGANPPTMPAGPNAVSYTDAFGHTVTDTTDAVSRLVKEVVADANSGAPLSTQTLAYAANGTYTTHTDLVTSTGTLTVDALYGPKGELSETLRDQQGTVTGTASITYHDDGTVGRHVTSADRPGFDDFVYSTTIGADNGGFQAHTHTDPNGTVITYDVNGTIVAISNPTPPVVSHFTPDFNGDGHSDILLQNASTGDVFLWEMNGTSLVGSGAVGWTPGAAWQVKDEGDYNGDGHADVLLQNVNTGDVYLWELNGTSLVNSGAAGWTPGAAWHATSGGDFNGDGKSDILLQNENTGDVYVWEMNGTGLVDSGAAGWTPGAAWQVKATGDFDGDGKSDIALQNVKTGDVYIWEMNGTGLAGSGAVGWTPGAAWQVKTSGDYNGDGKSDLLLQNANTGDVYIWQLNGTSLVGSGTAGWTPGAAWHATNGGDFNGDGKSDILLQNINTGDAYMWLMNGTSLVGNGAAGWTPGADWHIS